MSQYFLESGSLVSKPEIHTLNTEFFPVLIHDDKYVTKYLTGEILSFSRKYLIYIQGLNRLLLIHFNVLIQCGSAYNNVSSLWPFIPATQATCQLLLWWVFFLHRNSIGSNHLLQYEMLILLFMITHRGKVLRTLRKAIIARWSHSSCLLFEVKPIQRIL